MAISCLSIKENEGGGGAKQLFVAVLISILFISNIRDLGTYETIIDEFNRYNTFFNYFYYKEF